jgi:murein L,D-transpeptidase YcbB/YkuD
MFHPVPPVASVGLGPMLRRCKRVLLDGLRLAFVGGSLLLTGAASAADRHPGYQSFEPAIRAYAAIARGGGWPTVPAGPQLSEGARDPQVVLIRERLTISGDYAGEIGPDPYVFEPALDRAVRRFQQRHGLPVIGVVGPLTREAMNVSAAFRLQQLRMAAKSWRALPDALGERFVWVNLPAASLDAVESGKTALSMRTVIGKKSRQTPTLQSTIRQLELNPHWSVPRRIAVRDLLPRQQRDPGYFEAKAIRVFAGGQAGAPELAIDDVPWHELGRGRRFPYKLRQDPGPENSLGRVKIAFDNDEAIYLHDTPARSDFERTVRTLSSGCVRLEDALGLTRWLLQHNSRTDQSYVAGTHIHQHGMLRLNEPVPLYVVYLSGWVGADGLVHFRPDVYDRVEPTAPSVQTLVQNPDYLPLIGP